MRAASLVAGSPSLPHALPPQLHRLPQSPEEKWDFFGLFEIPDWGECEKMAWKPWMKMFDNVLFSSPRVQDVTLKEDNMPCCDLLLYPGYNHCDMDFTTPGQKMGHAPFATMDYYDQKYRDLCPATCAALTK